MRIVQCANSSKACRIIRRIAVGSVDEGTSSVSSRHSSARSYFTKTTKAYGGDNCRRDPVLCSLPAQRS